MGLAEKIRGNAYYDYEEEQRSSRAAEPAANPDGFQVVLVKPSQFEEGARIADQFTGSRVVVLNLDGAARDVARRLLDFLSGAAYARRFEVEQVANSTYLIRSLDSVRYEGGETGSADGDYWF
ncbi:MAG TPA: cell division protein SepF [Firmicutes bacterium]|nr:cell division protein SepF [Bacillota bacterium]